MTAHWDAAKMELEHKSGFEKWIDWAKAHQEALAVAGIVVILLGIGIPYYFHGREQAEKDAQGALSLGQYYLQSPVDPQRGPFKTGLERNQEALKTFQRVTTDYAGTTSAKLALYYSAKCQFASGQFTQAYANFEAVSREFKQTPLADQAALGKALCLESQAQWSQAATLYEAYLAGNPDSFLVPEMRLNLAAAYLKTQNKAKAAEQLKIVSQKFPDTSWGKQAAWRLTLMGSAS
jgi:TolA-binding protein